MKTVRVPDDVNPDMLSRDWQKHAWVCADGDPRKGPVENLEAALPFEVFVRHDVGGMVYIRSLKRSRGFLEARGAELAAPFELTVDPAGGVLVEVKGLGQKVEEECSLPIEECGPFSIGIDPRTKDVLYVRPLEEPEGAADSPQAAEGGEDGLVGRGRRTGRR